MDAQTADNEPSPAFALAPLLSFVLTLVMATMLFGYPGDARLAVSESHLRALTRPEGVDKARPADNLHLVSETGEGVRLYLVVMREGPPAAEAP
ncbi:MAG TPA: hypothetical protein PKZ76_15965 [Xanthomonadaceae bacterium]|nr:hypothetical protein [Xanthomonadaceae bacterium]